LFVLAGLGSIAYLSVQVGGLAHEGGFELYAYFNEIGGLAERAPVKISGVKMGQVSGVELDPESLRARVTLDLDPRFELSADTSAAVSTEGLLGNKFVSLDPGGEDDLLRHGEQIGFTEDAISIESTIRKLVHNTGLEDE
jgi:phospholipid/cholesterol/gamma-HCH transport system substrate-binding protein